jgi:hypothetical protein
MAVMSADTTDEIEARAITDEIRRAAEDLYNLLLEAHERRVWTVLGYRSWADYVHTEFDMSRSRAYQLIDRAKVGREITAAAGVSTSVDITEAQARDLKPVLGEVVDEIKTRVDRGDDPVEAVEQVVASTRGRRRTRRKFDPNQMISNVTNFEFALTAIVDNDLLDHEALDPSLIPGWLKSIADLRRALGKIETKLKAALDPDTAAA